MLRFIGALLSSCNLIISAIPIGWVEMGIAAFFVIFLELAWDAESLAGALSAWIRAASKGSSGKGTALVSLGFLLFFRFLRDFTTVSVS